MSVEGIIEKKMQYRSTHQDVISQHWC